MIANTWEKIGNVVDQLAAYQISNTFETVGDIL